MTTPEEWLALDDLPTELAKVLTPKAKHKWLEPAVYYGRSDPLGHVVKCQKCGHVKTTQEDIDGCFVPDRIKIDWNTAMAWLRKSKTARKRMAIWKALSLICRFVLGKSRPVVWWWVMFDAQPKHYLIAAAMAAEGSKE